MLKFENSKTPKLAFTFKSLPRSGLYLLTASIADNSMLKFSLFRKGEVAFRSNRMFADSCSAILGPPFSFSCEYSN